MGEYFLRRRNLVVVALLRNFVENIENELEEEDEEEAPAAVEHDEDHPVVVEEKPDIRYTAADSPNSRYVYTMPSGERRVASCDGVMCIVPPGDPMAYLGA